MQNTFLFTSNELVGAHVVSVHDGSDLGGGGGGIMPTLPSFSNGGDGGTTTEFAELDTDDDIDGILVEVIRATDCNPVPIA